MTLFYRKYNNLSLFYDGVGSLRFCHLVDALTVQKYVGKSLSRTGLTSGHLILENHYPLGFNLPTCPFHSAPSQFKFASGSGRTKITVPALIRYPPIKFPPVSL